jgi:hypothetical protein
LCPMCRSTVETRIDVCLFPTVYITVYIEVLFFYLFLYALGSNTVDGWKWLETGSVLSQREMTVRFHESG